ncbi:MAG: dockerin type I domain-containing protein [Clostridiales bacterium]|nr:dockerin type I domain-containing protein [Clostridiales bacterium]
MKRLISLFLIVALLVGVLPMTNLAAPVPVLAPNLKFDLDVIAKENSQKLAGVIAFAEGHSAGYGSNGKFPGPVGAPEPDAIPIYTAEDLDNVRENLSGSYMLMNDIDLADYNSGQWEPIGNSSSNSFNGVFDGQGYVIKNLTITSSLCQYAGLFGCTGNAEIKNVGLEGTDINVSYSSPGYSYAGGICGQRSSGNATISNCYNTGSIHSSNASTSTYAGGIIGGGSMVSVNTDILNCYNTGDILAFGSSDNYLDSYCAGGILGGHNYPSFYATFSNCFNKGAVSSSSASASSYAGGICSYVHNSISDCFNTGYISSSTSSDNSGPSGAGGICVTSYDSISDCYNVGDVSSSSASSEFGANAGGICSWIIGILSQSYNTGVVSASGSYPHAGGICSHSQNLSSILDSFNTGYVSAKSFSDRSNDRSYAGGICGVNYSLIAKCYNTGDASAAGSSSIESYAGGIAGFNGITTGSVSNCLTLSKQIYADASDPSYAYSYLISYGGKKSNNLALEYIEGNAIDDADDRITQAQAEDQGTYENLDWDFENIWYFVTGFKYPQLRGLPPAGPQRDGYSFAVQGEIRSYNPDNLITVQLLQDEIPVYTTIINATTWDQVGSDSTLRQFFTFEDVIPGKYDLVISKNVHTKFSLLNLVVSDADLDLTEEDDRPEIQLMRLRCGDISNDGLINDADLTILWRAGNYNKKTAEAENAWCDLNGDGLINDADLTILWLAYNYNRGSIVIDYSNPITNP